MNSMLILKLVKIRVGFLYFFVQPIFSLFRYIKIFLAKKLITKILILQAQNF